MLSNYENKRVNRELKGILRDFADTYHSLCDVSRRAYMATMPAGQPAPSQNRLCTDQAREEFSAKCIKLNAKADEVIDPVMKQFKEQITEAPGADAVNAINMLAMRKVITKDEIYDFLDRYGENVQAYKTIQSIGFDHEIRVQDNPHDAIYQDMDAVKASMHKVLSLQSAETGHAEEAAIAMVGMGIDSAFPAEG